CFPTRSPRLMSPRPYAPRSAMHWRTCVSSTSSSVTTSGQDGAALRSRSASASPIAPSPTPTSAHCDSGPSTRSPPCTTPPCGAESAAGHHVGPHDPLQQAELVDELHVDRGRRREHETFAHDELEEVVAGLLGGLDAARPPELEHRGGRSGGRELAHVDA